MRKKSHFALRLTGLCCCAALAISSFFAVNSAYVDSITGDANGDSKVNIKDMLVIDAYIQGKRTSVNVGSDIDGNGTVDFNDILEVKKIMDGNTSQIEYYLKGGDGNTYVTYSVYNNGKTTASNRYMCGYALYNKAGEVAYSEVTPLQQKILWNAKQVADYIKANSFSYGDAPYNPAMNHDAKKVSCDRFVGWVLYNSGYTDQPYSQGLVVSNPLSRSNSLVTWCINHGFTKIESIADLQPGDIIFTKPNGTTYPFHTFIYAGKYADGKYYRYDAGSVNRIQCTSGYSSYSSTNPYLSFTSGQPFVEGISEFMYAYRPV